MSWQHSLIAALLCLIAFAIAVCVRDSRRKRKNRALLGRLNSPFFRNVTDAYYRVGNISGVGR